MSWHTPLTKNLPSDPEYDPALDPAMGTLIPSPLMSHTHAIAPYPFDPNNLFTKALFFLPEHRVGDRLALITSQEVVVLEMQKLIREEEDVYRKREMLELKVNVSNRDDVRFPGLWRRSLGWAGAEEAELKLQRFRYYTCVDRRTSLLEGHKDKYIWNHEDGRWMISTGDPVLTDRREWICGELERIDNLRYQIEDLWHAENELEQQYTKDAKRKRKRTPECTDDILRLIEKRTKITDAPVEKQPKLAESGKFVEATAGSREILPHTSDLSTPEEYVMSRRSKSPEIADSFGSTESCDLLPATPNELFHECLSSPRNNSNHDSSSANILGDERVLSITAARSPLAYEQDPGTAVPDMTAAAEDGRSDSTIHANVEGHEVMELSDDSEPLPTATAAEAPHIRITVVLLPESILGVFKMKRSEDFSTLMKAICNREYIELRDLKLHWKDKRGKTPRKRQVTTTDTPAKLGMGDKVSLWMGLPLDDPPEAESLTYPWSDEEVKNYKSIAEPSGESGGIEAGKLANVEEGKHLKNELSIDTSRRKCCVKANKQSKVEKGEYLKNKLIAESNGGKAGMKTSKQVKVGQDKFIKNEIRLKSNEGQTAVKTDKTANVEKVKHAKNEKVPKEKAQIYLQGKAIGSGDFKALPINDVKSTRSSQTLINNLTSKSPPQSSKTKSSNQEALH